MTDKEKLDAIRAEIHRLVDVRGYDRGMANDLFAFINSLPNEPVSNDLEEFAKRESELFGEREYEIGYIDRNALAKGYYWGVKAGAQRQKEQLMKDAVDGEIYFSMDTLQYRIITEPLVNFHHGDKVKLIIIKEE